MTELERLATVECVRRWGNSSRAYTGESGTCYVTRAQWLVVAQDRAILQHHPEGAGTTFEDAFENATRRSARAAGVVVPAPGRILNLGPPP